MDGQDFLADLLGHVPEWQERALCAQTDPEAFFPEKGGSTREAKRICTRCDVKPECLEFALAHDERFGIWGGLSERERRKVKREAREAARLASAGVVIPMPARVSAQENPTEQKPADQIPTERIDAVEPSDSDHSEPVHDDAVHMAALGSGLRASSPCRGSSTIRVDLCRIDVEKVGDLLNDDTAHQHRELLVPVSPQFERSAEHHDARLRPCRAGLGREQTRQRHLAVLQHIGVVAVELPGDVLHGELHPAQSR